MVGITSALRSLTGAGQKNVRSELRKITHSSLKGTAIDFPPEALVAVAFRSNSEEGRREIMLHLCTCLKEGSSKNWQPVYAGLVLLECLLKSGSPELMKETAEGYHFDVVQRLSFLESFSVDDKCVQGMIRSKASSVRREVLAILESNPLKLSALEKERKSTDEAMDNASTCSPGSMHSSRRSTGTASTCGLGSDEFSDVLDNANHPDSARHAVKIGRSDDNVMGDSDADYHSSQVEAPDRDAYKTTIRERNGKYSAPQSLRASKAAGMPTGATISPPIFDLIDF